MTTEPQLPHTDRQPPNTAFVLRVEASRLRVLARQLDEAADEHEKRATPRTNDTLYYEAKLRVARANVGRAVQRLEPPPTN